MADDDEVVHEGDVPYHERIKRRTWRNYFRGSCCCGPRVFDVREKDLKKVVTDISRWSGRMENRVAELRREFLRLDKDRDKYLTERDADGELPLHVFRSILEAADIMGDGKLSMWEYALLHLAAEGNEKAAATILDFKCRRLFVRVDDDWDGLVGFHDVKRAVAFARLPMSDEVIQARLHKFDYNKDLKVNAEEFTLLLKGFIKAGPAVIQPTD